MSKKMASILLAYGVALAALGFLVQQSAPTLAKITFITGIAGGGLFVLWGIVALTGHKRRTWAILTMIAVTVVLLTQVVQAWLGASISLMGRLMLTVMFLMTMGMLLYLFHGERPPEFYTSGTARRDHSPSRGDNARSETGRHEFK
jgi:hypothetical protein